MDKLNKLILVFFFLNSFGKAYSQDTFLSKIQLIEDYELLYSGLTNYHPSPFLYIPEKELKTFYETQKSNFPDSLTALEFHILARQFIAQIKCGHTFAKPSDAWYASLKGKNVLLPFEIRNNNGRLYIFNTIDEKFEFDIYDELLSINNIEAKVILQEMSSIQERDGFTESLSKALIEKRFRTYFLFLYDVQDEFIIEFKTSSGEIKSTKVNLTNKKLKEVKKTELPSNFKLLMENGWSSFRFDSANNLAYLKINSFGDRKEFKKYYLSVFKQLNQYPNSQLIIDLRDNTGGYFGNGNNLLTYLTPNNFEFNFQKPKRKNNKIKYIKLDKWSKLTKMAFSIKPTKHKVKGQSITTFTYKPSKYNFEGKVYAITNGLTFSQATLVAAHLKKHGTVFFGEETGGAEMTTNALLSYELILPNSGVKVTIPHYQVISNSTTGQFGFGLKPDYPILPTLNTTTDTTLEKVIIQILSKQ